MTERRYPYLKLNQNEIAALVRLHLPSIDKVTLLTDGAGMINTHYEVMAKGRSYILRLYQRTPPSLIKERQIHERLAAQPFMPKMIGWGEDPYPYALFHKYPGKPLSQAPWPPEMSYTLGKILATIHQYTYNWSGLCEKGLTPDGAFGETDDPYYQEAYRLLTAGIRAPARLGGPLTEQILEWIERKRSLFPKLGTTSHLVHSDFHPNNILMDPKEGLCVLDWEFFHVGNPLFDFSTLLRNRTQHPLNLAELRSGYLEHGGHLPDHWEHSAALGDVVNTLQILERPADLPHCFAFLIEIIQKNLSDYLPD